MISYQLARIVCNSSQLCIQKYHIDSLKFPTKGVFASCILEDANVRALFPSLRDLLVNYLQACY